MTSHPAILVFDIDQTLLKTGGASFSAMTQAFEELYGIRSAFDGLSWAGRTDISIFREVLVRHGRAVEPFAEQLAAYEARYSELISTALATHQGHLLPGVVPLLARLAADEDMRLGIGTGNFMAAGWAKLSHYGLAQFFATGGFGSDAEDRGEIIRIAAERINGGEVDDDARRRVLVLGDSIHDVSAALANGFVAVGVAAGDTPAEALAGAGAHAILPGFADTDGSVAALKSMLGD